MRFETERNDITVLGGGLAGVCAAVAAARCGRRVALVNNRPVLGGNSSSEVRVWVCGATGHGVNRNARENGLMGELFVENQYRNAEGNPYLWDTTVLDLVRAEPLLRLFLDTDVHELEADGPEDRRHIHAVTGWMMGSERRIRFESPIFVDCTGDGLVGYLAGARFRKGREGRAEYGEEWAPLEPDDVTLGSTLLFYTKDAGVPVPFVAPSFAKDITATPIPERRVIRTGDNGCSYWWIEWGGELDTVHDNSRIRDELWAVIYGIWDYIKNSGKFDADTMTLEWVGSLPGKREYRRLVGDYTLTEADVLSQTCFADRVAFGGWSIDLHPPGGMYAEESASRHRYADGVYHIPYRSLYSINVENLLMAGRNISASHVAFGSARVMATCATVGEAAGTAAALCSARGVTPRRVAQDHIDQLQQLLLRHDGPIVGVANSDPDDMARSALVEASGWLETLRLDEPDESWPLESDAGICLPVDPQLDSMTLLLDANASSDLTLEIHDPGNPQNYVPARLIDRRTVEMSAGSKQWVTVPLGWRPAQPGNGFVVVRANSALSLWTTSTVLPGVLCFTRTAETVFDGDLRQRIREWDAKPFQRASFCLATAPESSAWSPAQAIGGFARPYGGPHLWASEPLDKSQPPWLALRWPAPRQLGQIEIVFDDDPNEDLINLHHHRTPFRVMPTLVRDYRIEVEVDGTWQPAVHVEENRQRRRVHQLDHTSDALRLVCEATNGAPRAHVVSIRVYAPR